MELLQSYKQHRMRKLVVLIVLLILTFLFTVTAVMVGASGLGFIDVVKALFGFGEKNAILIVRNIRFPRVLAGIIAGGGLAISGLMMQNVLKNPIASPSTLGVGNAAVFGANFAIIIVGAGSFHSTHGNWLTIENPYLVSGFAFFFSVLCVGIILFLSAIKKFSPSTIVLAGVAMGSIFQAGSTIIQYFAEDTQVASAVYWTFGDLGRATYNENYIMLTIVLLSFLYFYWKRWDYASMANGIVVAKTLGVKTARVTTITLLLSSLITAVCVSFLGIIGFVGLIAPQIMRRVVGDDYRYLLPCSLLTGSILLLVSDTVGRLVLFGSSLPVGAVTSLLGGPMFLYLLLRGKKNAVRG